MRHQQAVLVVRSRQVRVAGVARTVRSALVRVPSDGRVFRRRRASIAAESRRDPRSRVNSPRLRAAELCSVCVMLIKPSRGSARKGRGLEPRRVHLGRDAATGRWGNAHRSTAPAPQSKPVTPASRLVAQEAPLVASGLGLRILAAGPAPVRLYSYRGRLCEPGLKSLRGLVRRRGHRLISRQRPGGLARSLPAAESLTETRHDETAWSVGISTHSRFEPHRAQVLRSDDETPARSPSACPAARSYKNIRPTSAPTCSSSTARSRSRRMAAA
jgi:hypothetical protein